MKRIIFILIILLSSTILKAEFDTLWTKNDYRITLPSGFLNDSILVLSMHLAHHQDSMPYSNTQQYYDFVVNYNINSMTYTNIYEGQNPNISKRVYGDTIKNYSLYASAMLSIDKSKLICTKEIDDNKLYIHNTIDGTLDTILEFSGMNLKGVVRNEFNEFVTFWVESKDTLTKYGYKQSYIGELNLSNYSSTFLKLSTTFDMTKFDDTTTISNMYILKSYKYDSNKLLVLTQHYRPNNSSTLFGFNYDSLAVTNDNERIKSGFELNSGFLEDKLSNDKYIVTTKNGTIKISKADSLEFFEEHYLKKYFQHSDTTYEYLGNYIDANIMAIKLTYANDSNIYVNKIMLYDYELDEYKEEMEIDLTGHEYYINHKSTREIYKLLFINDTTAYSIIPGTMIKFHIDNSLNLKNRESEYEKIKYKVYPNPTSGIINIEYNSEKTESANIEIIDELGEAMGNFKKQVFAGVNTLNYDITNYPKGIYFVRIKEQNITFKVVKE